MTAVIGLWILIVSIPVGCVLIGILSIRDCVAFALWFTMICIGAWLMVGIERC